jgi:hypothetical protein
MQAAQKVGVSWAQEEVDHNDRLILNGEGDYVKSHWVHNSPKTSPNYKPMLITRNELLNRVMTAQHHLERVRESITSMEELLNGPKFEPAKEEPKA